MVKLSEMGEYVKTASSTVEQPVADRLRRCYPASRRPATTSPPPRFVAHPDDSRTESLDSRPPQRVAPRSPRVQTDPLGIVRPKPTSKPVYYKGQLKPLAQVILDEDVIYRQPRRGRPRPGGPYLVDQVELANKIAADWVNAALGAVGDFEPTPELVGPWLRHRKDLTVDQAVAFHQAGIGPDDIGEYESYGSPSVLFKLSIGNITIEQAIAEARRSIGQSGAA